MSSPAIRFAGFTDDWEERKIQDLADRHDNLRIPITASNRVSGNTPYYGANGIQDYVEGFTHDGEFILVAEDGANDLQDYPVNYVNFKVWVNNHAHVLQAKQFQADNKFLMNALKHTDIEPYLVGGGRAKLNAGTMMEISFPIPTVAEQSRIGKFFFALDDRITLHQRAHDKTVNIKKALLEKMFPKDGEDKPQIRFSGFTDAWEQRKLGEYCDMYNGDRGINYPNATDMVADGIPFINAGDLQNGRVNLAAANHITRAKYHQLGGAKIQIGDIVYCLRGTLGKNAFIDNFNEGTVASSLVVIRPKNIDRKYLFQVINSDIEYRQRMLCDEGAAQPNLSARNLNGFDIPVPSIDEQKRISALFDDLDRLIALHQHELTKFQNIKKALLEKMFV